MKTLEELILCNPQHLKLEESGYGEFPDSFILTPKGIAVFSKIIEVEKIKAQIEVLEKISTHADGSYIHQLYDLKQQLKELEDE